ncbi:MAG: hypothetical protein ACJ8BW_39910, partial [Ktedonobacteraceae bacterium]
QWACFSSQRVADGTAVHVRSPAQGSVSCHAILTDDQGAVSLSMDTGVVGLTSWRRVLSALSIEGGSLEVTRSQVVFHFHFYFLLCHRGAELVNWLKVRTKMSVSSLCVRRFSQITTRGKLTEGLTFFALKGGNVMRRVGINWFESGNTALEAAHCTRHV